MADLQTHSSPVEIEFGNRSWAYYAIKPSGRALVFVHGFKGESISTWSNFHGLIFKHPAFAEFDCFFLGYDGMYESLIASAQRFYVFMCDLFSTGQAVRNKLCMLDDRELPYREVVVVTHSMGSVVVRKAMVEADEDKHPWTRQVSLVLYAPAHLGARVVRYISQSLDSTLLRPLVPLLKYKCQPIDELKPNSELLKTLAQEVTDRLKADPEKRFLIARRVIHAYGDNVVLKRDKRFCLDPKATWIEGDHFSISKPANDSSEPLLQLLAALGDADGR